MLDVTRYAGIARELIETGHFLYAQGWSPATSSNYSARIDDEHLAITVSGRHKGHLVAEDIMVVDREGQPVQSDARASAETLLHTAVYDLFPGMGVVLHTHSINATVLSRIVAPESTLRLTGYELQKAFPGHNDHDEELAIPIFENTQNISALAAHTQDWFRQHPEQPGYLIRGHGLYTWGESMADCLRHVEAFEFLFACELEMRKLRL